MRQRWTEWDKQTVGWLYPHVATAKIAVVVGRSASSIYQLAQTSGWFKTETYLASEDACRMRRGNPPGVAFRFPKGHVPMNKGLRRPGWAPGRMASTQFTKGQMPHNGLPLGSTRVSKDGYLQRKVSETGYPPKDWVGVHILTWCEANGPLPPSHAVTFKNGDKQDARLENLELLSRAQLMRRNTIHNLPAELAEVCRLRGVLKRTIGSRHAKEQNVRPA